MSRPRSALASACEPGVFGTRREPPAVVLGERPPHHLVQLSGWPDSFGAICARITSQLALRVPVDCLVASVQEDVTIFRVGPTRLWFVCSGDCGQRLRDVFASFGTQDAVITEIGHSRTVIRVSGPEARTLLNRGLPIDLDNAAFPEHVFVQSVIHHVPVLVHRLPAKEDTVFDLYVPREYAVTFWEWLVEVAAPLGGRVERAAA